MKLLSVRDLPEVAILFSRYRGHVPFIVSPRELTMRFRSEVREKPAAGIETLGATSLACPIWGKLVPISTSSASLTSTKEIVRHLICFHNIELWFFLFPDGPDIIAVGADSGTGACTTRPHASSKDEEAFSE